MGNWDNSVTTRDDRLELIRLVIQVTREHYDLWGQWPNALEIATRIGLVEKHENSA